MSTFWFGPTSLAIIGIALIGRHAKPRDVSRGLAALSLANTLAYIDDGVASKHAERHDEAHKIEEHSQDAIERSILHILTGDSHTFDVYERSYRQRVEDLQFRARNNTSLSEARKWLALLRYNCFSNRDADYTDDPLVRSEWAWMASTLLTDD